MFFETRGHLRLSYIDLQKLLASVFFFKTKKCLLEWKGEKMRQDFLIFDFLTQRDFIWALELWSLEETNTPSSAGGLPDEKTPTSDENILLSLKKTPHWTP